MFIHFFFFSNFRYVIYDGDLLSEYRIVRNARIRVGANKDDKNGFLHAGKNRNS